MSRAEADAIPAATVVVMRDAAHRPPELLMVERAAAMAFAGGAMVFPGGRVDAGDLAYAALLGADDLDEAAARIAAVREAIEEAGIAPGVAPPLGADALSAVRDALHRGAPIGAAMANAAIDIQALVPFARWLPRDVSHRIFDTRFYLARLPQGAPAPQVDATENSRLAWMTAGEVLAQADAGHVRIIFPTRRNLERLALYRSFAEAVAHARAVGVRTVTPWIETRAGVDHLCIPDDLGYPVTAEPLRSADRA